MGLYHTGFKNRIYRKLKYPWNLTVYGWQSYENEIDIDVEHRFLHPGASGERKLHKYGVIGWKTTFWFKLWGHLRWECKFWSFGESRFSLIEAPNIEFLTLKRIIVHRIIWMNQFAVRIEKILALGDRLKEKMGGHWVRAIDFHKTK